MKEKSSQVRRASSFSGTDSRPTVSVSYIRRVHVSVAPELDIGTFQQSGVFLLSDDVHGFHIDTNGIVAEQAQDGVRRAQFGQTLSVSHQLRKLTISEEIWHFSQPFEHGNALGNLWAVSYPLRKNLVMDGGFNHGLTKTSTQWEVFVGFTYLTASSSFGALITVVIPSSVAFLLRLHLLRLLCAKTNLIKPGPIATILSLSGHCASQENQHPKPKLR
jgi:hypothetical protein